MLQGSCDSRIGRGRAGRSGAPDLEVFFGHPFCIDYLSLVILGLGADVPVKGLIGVPNYHLLNPAEGT